MAIGKHITTQNISGKLYIFSKKFWTKICFAYIFFVILLFNSSGNQQKNSNTNGLRQKKKPKKKLRNCSYACWNINNWVANKQWNSGFTKYKFRVLFHSLLKTKYILIKINLNIIHVSHNPYIKPAADSSAVVHWDYPCRSAPCPWLCAPRTGTRTDEVRGWVVPWNENFRLILYLKENLLISQPFKPEQHIKHTGQQYVIVV